MVIKLSPQIEKIGANSKTLFSFLNNILVFGGIFLLIMSTLYVVWIFLFFSHRIAGPIFRFEKVFEKLAQGDLTERIYLREKDEFKDVASKYNDTMDNLRERLDEINMYNTELKALLTSLQDQGKIANPEAIQKIFSIHESISKTLKTLKI
jgi:methyl-accepting chemotaxis protein